MATRLVMASLSRRCNFLALVVFLGYFHKASCYTPHIRVNCEGFVNVAKLNYDAGLLVSDLSERLPIYPNTDRRCDITLAVPTGHQIMIYFDMLDFYGDVQSNCEKTNIELFDGVANQYVTGLDRKVCGQDAAKPSEMYFLDSQFLKIRVNAPDVIRGAGFRIHFTVASRSFPCSTDEFACESFGTKRCIAEHLVCDEWNDCGDWVDEEQNCSYVTAGGIAAIVLSSILIVALIIAAIIVCKIRSEQQLLEREGIKDSAMMRDTSAASGGFASPYSVSSETLEKERYASRNSGRRGRDFEDNPPPYTEKPLYDSSRSEEGMFDDDGRPRSRGSKHRSRQDPDDVYKEEDEVPRGRRGRSRSQDRESVTRGRPKYDDAEAEEDEEEGDRRARYPPRDSARNYDRYQRDRDDRYPPSRRDDRDRDADRDSDNRYSRDDNRDRDRERDRDRDRYPGNRRDDRDRDSDSRHSSRDDYRDRDRERDRDRDRYPGNRRDDRDRDSDSKHSSRDDDRYPSRRPDDRDRDRDSYRERDRDRERERSRERDRERERDRDRDRDQGSRRDRPRSRSQRDEPEDDYVDQLHPLRDVKRRSTHSDSDQDTSRDSDKRTPDRDRDRPRDDDRSPQPPRPSSSRDDRSPASTRDRPADKPRDTPTSRRGPASTAADENYESSQAAPVSSSRAPRASRPESRGSAPAQPPADDKPDLSAEELPTRRRRRRSRSREGQERPRSSRYKDAEDEGGAGRQGRARAEEEPRGGRSSGRQSMGGVGGYTEEAV